MLFINTHWDPAQADITVHLAPEAEQTRYIVLCESKVAVEAGLWIAAIKTAMPGTSDMYALPCIQPPVNR